MYCGVYNMYISKIYNNNTEVDMVVVGVGGRVLEYSVTRFYIIYEVM